MKIDFDALLEVVFLVLIGAFFGAISDVITGGDNGFLTYLVILMLYFILEKKMSNSWLILKEDYKDLEEKLKEIKEFYGEDSLFDELEHILSYSAQTSPIDPSDFADDEFSKLVHKMNRMRVDYEQTK